MILFEARASIILYNILTSLEKPKKFILPLNVCPIVPATFLKAKVEFEFIDISLETLCIDEKLLLNKVHDKNIGGVLYVKTYGIELDTTQLFKDIKNINQNIFIIDDCCLQIPKFDYTLKESYADLALFSTGYSKYIDIGWGGFGFLNDDFSYKKNNLTFKEKDLEAFTRHQSTPYERRSGTRERDTRLDEALCRRRCLSKPFKAYFASKHRASSS